MVVAEKIEIDQNIDQSQVTVGDLKEMLSKYSDDMVIADISDVYQISADRLRIV